MKRHAQAFLSKFKSLKILEMKKTIKLMAFAAIAAIGCFAGMQALSSNSESKPSSLILANVEALSTTEEAMVCKWLRIQDERNCWYHVCLETGTGDICVCGSVTY